MVNRMQPVFGILRSDWRSVRNQMSLKLVGYVVSLKFSELVQKRSHFGVGAGAFQVGSSDADSSSGTGPLAP